MSRTARPEHDDEPTLVSPVFAGQLTLVLAAAFAGAELRGWLYDVFFELARTRSRVFVAPRERDLQGVHVTLTVRASSMLSEPTEGAQP